jgi:hypothetical protein
MASVAGEVGRESMSDRILKRDRPSSNYTSQIEAWQALLKKLGGNQGAIASSNADRTHQAKGKAIASSNYSSRLRCGSVAGKVGRE